MTSFFHDLEEQLRSAARQRTGAASVPERSPRGRSVASGLRAVPVIVAVAVTLAIVAGALLVLVPGHSHTPPTPPAGGGLGAILGAQPQAQIQRELRLIAQATRSVQQSAVCRRSIPTRVRLIQGRPSQALMGVLGVLRRRPTVADHLAMHLFDSDAPIYAGSIRRAFRAAGTSYYIYVEHDTGAGYPSDRCLTLQVEALNRALPTLPGPLRAPTRMLEARLVAYERKLKAFPHQDTLCFVMWAHNGESSSCGAPASQLQTAGVAPESLSDTMGGIVPDGVASVTLRYPARGGHPARSFTSSVRGNVYAVRMAGISGGPEGAPTIIWRAAGGRVLKVITPPAPETARQGCQAHPLPCLAVEGGTPARSSGSASASATAPAAVTPHPKSAG
ncbi:MAG: hypothetical protein ACRDPM_24855 [Solirubrobacteraceae bacterium]